MTTLVVGASGATGQLLVTQLLEKGQKVRVIVRPDAELPAFFQGNTNLTVIGANVLDLSDAEMIQHVSGCDAVTSCLGHTLSLKGIFGSPRKLVTEAARRLCTAVRATRPDAPVKFVLMNSAGNSNRDLDERISFGQQCVIWLLRLLLPPHTDNETAADFLRTEIGQNDKTIEWSVVRPDSLIDEGEVSAYEVHVSPIRSAIFDPGTTSRINVANLMAELITDPNLWKLWKGKMPVIYNRKTPTGS